MGQFIKIESDLAGIAKITYLPITDYDGSIIGHRIDYNGVRALRGQRHIPRKKLPKYPPPDFERLFFRFTQFGGFSTFRILITFVTQDL